MIDAYSLRARAAPAALAALPALVLAGGALAAIDEAGSILTFALSAALVVTCGLVRNAGLALQPKLWREWAGPPTTRMLRWEGNDHSEIELRHQRVKRLTTRDLPSRDEEAADPRRADELYASAVADLRDHTRDKSQFSLVATENAEYGFRRNCFGLKPYAISVAVVVGIAGAILGATHSWELRYVLPLGASIIALGGWAFLVKAAWVKQAADLYAERLLEALARLTRGDA